jgi:cell filamentation protein
MTPARDGLPTPLRHAIDQTIAAERLEGWQPTDDHIDALIRLLSDETPFGEYLASYRAVHPSNGQPHRRDYRHILRRSRPYLIPGTMVLRNNFEVDSQAALSDLEFVATAGRMAMWHRMLADGAIGVHMVDVRAIHQHLFSDVYSWAGSYRITELRRGDSIFAWQSALGRLMALLEETARALAANGAGLDSAGLAYRLARLYADYNHIHPFRDGNGRTGTLLLHTIAALCGRRLDLTAVPREEWYVASRDSMPFRRDGRPNHRPFLSLFAGALSD